MKLKLKDSKGNLKEIEVEGTQTTQELKKTAAELYNIKETDNLKLIFRGKLLADDKTLDSYEVKEDGLIMIMQPKAATEQKPKTEAEGNTNVD